MVRPGDSPSIRCEVSQGDQPITINWARQDGTRLPTSVTVAGEVIQFLNIAVSEAGQYVCTASNKVGESQAVADVVVMTGDSEPAGWQTGGPVLEMISSQGATVDLQCRLNPASDLVWRRDGGVIPQTASQLGNVLRIENVSVEDSGRYGLIIIIVIIIIIIIIIFRYVCTSGGRMQYVTLLVERKTPGGRGEGNLT